MLSLLHALALATGPTTPLSLSVDVQPRSWVHRVDKVALTVSLSNTTEQPMEVLTGAVGHEAYFFIVRLVDASGKVVAGEGPLFMATSDLPMPEFTRLAPHATYQATLDWRLLYNLAPGKYRLSVLYRVDPRADPSSAGYYQGELKDHRAFVGQVESNVVEVVARDH